jgi:general secretion pathway protein F
LAAFRFAAADASGKEQSGVLEADSARVARQLLRGRGLIPLTVEPVYDEDTGTGVRMRIGRRLSQTELAVITRQLASLLGAQLPVADALTVMVEQSEKQQVRELMAAIRTDVLSGTSLSKALARHPRQFPEIYRALIAAGEESGKLGTVLGSLADYIEERARLQQKITLAFVYPAIVTIVALLVVVGLLTYVVPQVVQVFENIGQELPLLTRALIALSAFLRSYGIFLLLLIIGAAFGFQRSLKNPDNLWRFHAFLHRLPLIARLKRGLNTARFARTLSILAASGVPVLEALRIAGQVMSSLPMRAAVEAAAARVREGSSLAAALERSGYFPPMALHLIASGESSGKLESMLERAAENQERELETTIAALMGMFEPLLILVMGGLVLIIVLAILLPIFDLNQLVK